jgi:hypothetical protein
MKVERFFEGQPTSTPVVDEKMTRQSIFDLVVRHYRKQRRRCPVEGRCFYRFAGDMCFAGLLIDDTHYDRDMEGYRVRDLLKIFALPTWFQDNINFIEELQTFHDTETNWPVGRMDIVLELFATERGLTMPAVS